MPFVTRKIKDGKVKIRGRWYKPSEQFMTYDGRLDGLWYVFGTYNPGHFVSLWGTREMSDKIDRIEETDYGPELVGDGFPWVWWNEIEKP